MSGYAYTAKVTKINSKYSEIASAIFRNKLVIVSSKKIGALGNGKDKNTNEPYTDLFCLDINNEELSYPILFSRILNTKANEGQVSFSPDEHTIYYTRSKKDNSLNYKLYKAELKKNSYGKWINEIELTISSNNYSIENPHVADNGKSLYFSSNMEGGFGGFDIYKATINEDGTLGEYINLGNTVNSDKDEKYPHTSKDGKELFFSSKGHNSIGGFDIFISNISRKIYSTPRNLGRIINSNKDDIAFVLIDDNNGVFSSNKDNPNNGFNMYRFKSEALYQNLQGIVLSEDEKALPNTTVILLDSDGLEIERQITNNDAFYSFKVKPFRKYQLKALKEGFDGYTVKFQSKNIRTDVAFQEILKLSSNTATAK